MTGTPFATQLATWDPFYMTVAAACATLIGLLFLAMSLNLDLLRRDANGDLLRQARQSFGNLMFALAVSLVFLVPFDEPLGIFFALLTLSIGGLAATIHALIDARRGGAAWGQLLREVSLSLFAYACLIFVAFELAAGDTGSLYTLVAVIAAMLVRPSRNAWNFLLQSRVTGPKGKSR